MEIGRHRSGLEGANHDARIVPRDRVMTPVTSSSQLSGRFRPLPPIAELEDSWRRLEAESGCSFFQSWGWIGPWLHLMSGRHRLRLYECRTASELAGMAVLTETNLTRRRLVKVRTLALHETPAPDLDMCIEYNAPIARTGMQAAVLAQLVRDAAAELPDWDEFRLSNVGEALWNEAAAAAQSCHPALEVRHPTWVAGLEGAADLEALLQRLGSGRRSKIRRSLREYGSLGELHVTAARDEPTALDFFDRLGRLHTRRWNRAGKDGSFANPCWVEFHRKVISSGIARDEVQLLRIHAGERDIGYLYNLIWRGTVNMLQSGFAEESSNILRPGYVSHLLAMQFNALLGNIRYDFLIGDSEYKRVLSTMGPHLASGRLQRERVTLRLERLAERIYRRLRAPAGAR